MKRHRLKLTSLKFISSVDAPAQETATALLFKRATNAPIAVKATARVAKLSSDELGLVFGWALTTKSAGADYWDLHGDNIVEEDLIAVAASFMEAGGAADTNHDREQDGRVVFAMPLTAEVARAFGIETDTHGLMIAIKPSVEDFALFKSGELKGFSIDGMGERTPADGEVAARKHALYTTEVDGHAHTVDVSYGIEAGCSWYTSYQNADGATSGHSHAVVRNADASVTILADSGHTHELAADQPAVIVVPANAVIVVENRADPRPLNAAPTDKSTRSPETQRLNIMQTDADKLAALQKQFDRLASVVKLAPDLRLHFDALIGDAQDEFLAKSTEQRTEIVKANTEVMHTCTDGTKIYKRDGDLALRLAKQADEAHKAALVEKAARELTELTKRAGDTLGALAGKDGVHVDVLRAVESISDATKRDAAIATLKAANDAMKARGTAPGVGGSDLPVSEGPQGEFDALVAKYIAENKCEPGVARLAVSKTEKGRALYGEIEQLKKSRIHG